MRSLASLAGEATHTRVATSAKEIFPNNLLISSFTLQNATLDIEGWKYFIDQAFHPCRCLFTLAKFVTNQFHYSNWPNNATCRLPENKATCWCSPKGWSIICTAIHNRCLRYAGLKQNVLYRCHAGKCFEWEMPKNYVNFRPKQMRNKKQWNKLVVGPKSNYCIAFTYWVASSLKIWRFNWCASD